MLSMMQQVSAIRSAPIHSPLPSKLTGKQIDERVWAAVTDYPGSTVAEIHSIISHPLITTISVEESLRRMRHLVVLAQASQQTKARIWTLALSDEAEAYAVSGDCHWQQAYRAMKPDVVYSTVEVSEMIGIGNEAGLRAMKSMVAHGRGVLVCKRGRGGCFWRKVEMGGKGGQS